MKSLQALLYKVGYPIAKLYWYITRPTTQGVRCLIVNEGNVLLITHTYGSPLKTVVGGGVNKGEDPEQAVFREVKEEVGIILNEVVLVGTMAYTGEFKKDTINVYVAETSSTQFVLDISEIQEAGWYPLDNLPQDMSPLFIEFLELAKPYLQEELKIER